MEPPPHVLPSRPVRPDVVLLSEGDRDAWVIVEVQLARDDDRQRRWLAATPALLDARGAMGDLVVIPERLVSRPSVWSWRPAGRPVARPSARPTLLTVLADALRLFVDDASRERIEHTDLLTRWIKRAVTAAEPG